MSKFVNIEFKYLSYDSAAQSNDPADCDKQFLRVQESSASQVFRLQQAIANATVDLAISLPASPTDYLIISSDQSISVKLNGGATAQALNVKAPGTKCPLLFQRGAITGLLISNASGVSANVDITLVKV
jgi:hypothetical protein